MLRFFLQHFVWFCSIWDLFSCRFWNMLELFKHHRKLSKKYVPKPPYFLDFFQICCRKSNFSFCDVPKAGFSARRPPRRFDLSAESVKSPTFASFAGTKKTMIVKPSLLWHMKYRQTAYAISLSFGSPTLSLFRVQRFVGLLTFTFRCNLFNCTSARISPSLRATTALPMTGFRRMQMFCTETVLCNHSY